MKSRGLSQVLCLGLAAVLAPVCGYGQPTRQPLTDRLKFLPGFSEAKSWSWEATYTLTRLEAAHGDTGEYYRDGVLYNGLNWFRPLDEARQLYWLATYDVAWRHASPSEFDRVENTLTLNLLYYPHTRVRLAPFLQPSLYSYLKDTSTQDDRHDFNLNMGVDVSWYPRPEISLHAAAIWTLNYSDAALQDYSVASPAFSLFASFWF